jgi:uncharacterized protein (DUF2062 family)
LPILSLDYSKKSLLSKAVLVMKEYIKKILHKLVLAERSPTKLTLSFCLGNFIAWSPTIPLQTPLIFLLSWLFRLNTTVTFTTVYIINNPLTMVPLYVADYMFGVLLFHKVLGLDLIRYNPSWVDKFNAFISRYINMEKYIGGGPFCFWCLMLGGLILPLLISIVLYPIMKPVFTKFVARTYKDKE